MRLRTKRRRATTAVHSRRNSLGRNSLGRNSLGRNSLGRNSLGRNSLGRNSLGRNSLGRNSLGRNSLGRNSLGRNSLGRKSLGRKSLRRKSLGGKSEWETTRYDESLFTIKRGDIRDTVTIVIQPGQGITQHNCKMISRTGAIAVHRTIRKGAFKRVMSDNSLRKFTRYVAIGAGAVPASICYYHNNDQKVHDVDTANYLKLPNLVKRRDLTKYIIPPRGKMLIQNGDWLLASTANLTMNYNLSFKRSILGGKATMPILTMPTIPDESANSNEGIVVMSAPATDHTSVAEGVSFVVNPAFFVCAILEQNSKHNIITNLTSSFFVERSFVEFTGKCTVYLRAAEIPHVVKDIGMRAISLRPKCPGSTIGAVAAGIGTIVEGATGLKDLKDTVTGDVAEGVAGHVADRVFSER